MRIGFDAKRLFNNFTGLGNYSRFVLSALLEHFPSHHYTLYSPKIKDHNETRPFRVNPKVLIRTPPKWVKGSGFGSFWRSVNLGNIAFRDGADIFHGLSNELPLTKPKGLKTVVTIHDLIFVRDPELYSSIDVKIYKKKLSHACKSADKLIAISQQTAKDLQHYLDVPKDRIKVVYQGCHEIFKERHSAEAINKVREKYQLPGKYLLSVGTLEPRKNALLILKALAKLDGDVSLVLIGRSTSYQTELDKFIDLSGLKEKVFFIQKVSFEDLPKIYQGSEIFIYPSKFEGFGIPIVEAIQSEVPVIAATGSCLEEAGGPSCIYVDPDGADELAEAIARIRKDPTRSSLMVKNSLQYVKKFDAGRIAADLVRVYEEVLG